MFSHVFVGVTDFDRALTFYRALMPVLVALAQWGGDYLFDAKEKSSLLLDAKKRRPLRPLQGNAPQHVRSHGDLIAALALLLETSGTSRRQIAKYRPSISDRSSRSAQASIPI